MTFWILFALAIYFAQTLLPPVLRYALRADPQILASLGARDTPPETTVYGARSERALRNSTEGLIIFLPLALLARDSPEAVAGAAIFVLARLAYVPIYILGVPVVRSIIWAVGVVGLALMALAIQG